MLLSKKKFEALKKFLNTKSLLTNNSKRGSYKTTAPLPYINVDEMLNEPKVRINQLTGKKVPDYLKEDFPSRSLHNARI